MYNSKIYKTFSLKYCKGGFKEKNEIFFKKNFSNFKLTYIYLFNLIFENFSLFFIKIYLKKKRIAKFAEIIPKLLTKLQRFKKTLIFLKKYWKLFDLKRHVLTKQKNSYRLSIFKNQLNYSRWK